MKDWIRLLVGCGVVLAVCFSIGNFLLKGPRNPPEALIADLRGEATECAVHGLLLEEEVLGVFYGYIDYDPEFSHAAADLFPHAMSGVGDGPEVDGKSYARVRFCSDCRRAEAEWRAEVD